MGYSKLGRNSSARKALFRSVLVSFFKHERIETTEAKAKEISGLAEKLITLAKRDDLSARRQVIQIWFAQNSILVNHKNAWGKTPLEIAEQMPYRASLLERMKKYE